MLADLLMASKAYEEALQVILHRTRKSFSFVPIEHELFQVLGCLFYCKDRVHFHRLYPQFKI